ncbi:MAG: hypothetical protein PVF47_19490 [Anaerolineae bacterium]|jgi:hypothetical protein
MTQKRTVQLFDKFDVSVARAQVQEIARAAGFDLLARARISVVVSLLAEMLNLGYQRPGRVTVASMDGSGPPGVRIDCLATGAGNLRLLPGMEKRLQGLVDRLSVEQAAPGTIQVTAIKWLHEPQTPEALDGQID